MRSTKAAVYDRAVNADTHLFGKLVNLLPVQRKKGILKLADALLPLLFVLILDSFQMDPT
eukprot:CAMPEP_0181511784 /NCGR_PEP_ID=MMETSP1110-20121109/61621_1 /TAXON_ID=174948 /ORGANISM="Symbiodinium sp., Strain CCMP421" /LENGTH=59 /DNA_ID=CAMNT_0023641549 /DNA_START=124 /DNA_END=300 /DNA_ORIENTATION=+